jgi:hypothetical protein
MLLGGVDGSLILREDAMIFRSPASSPPQALPAESPFGYFPVQQIFCTTSFTQALYPHKLRPFGARAIGGFAHLARGICISPSRLVLSWE